MRELVKGLEKNRQESLKADVFNKYIEKVKEDAQVVYHSVRIENNTMTLNDIKILLNAIRVSNENKIHSLKSKYSIEEVLEVSDLKNAVDFMYSHINEREVSEEFISELHAFTTFSDDTVDSGEYKTFDNYTKHKGSVKIYLPADKVYDAMYRMVEEYNYSNKTIEDIAKLKLEFTHIHPFSDGNGRMGRLLLNWALLSNDYPPIIITEDEKSYYIQLLNEYGRTGDTSGFAKYICYKLSEVYEQMLGC